MPYNLSERSSPEIAGGATVSAMPILNLRSETHVKRLNVLLWHLHGNYLYYLTHAPHTFYVPSKPGRQGHYAGRCGHLPWGDNLVDVPADQVKNLALDCVIYQQPVEYQKDRFEILSPAQRALPGIYLQHDPPRGHPTDTRHLVDDPNVLLVHVTSFNDLMWDSGRTPTMVIDHGVVVPPHVRYTGELDRGIAVVNNLGKRGRLVGADVYAQIRRNVPLDLAGMGSEVVPGGVGEVVHGKLAEFESRYRFFFNPIRYTSLGLSVLEAMTIGMPIIGLATTEMVSVIENGVNGYVDTDLRRLELAMKDLIRRPAEARRLGENARRTAMERFNIDRFVRDWNVALARVTGRPSGRRLEVLQ